MAEQLTNMGQHVRCISEAKSLARQHGCFVFEKGGVCYLYREAQPKNVYVGKHKTAEGILKLTKKVCQKA